MVTAVTPGNMTTLKLGQHNQEKARLIDGLCLLYSLFDGLYLSFLFTGAGGILGSGKGSFLFCQAFGFAADIVNLTIHFVAIVSVVETIGASLGALFRVFYCLKELALSPIV
ncbi:hypothetical protein ES703_42472 [subsurface metagenome]